MTNNGYAGSLGYASAAAQADFIVPNMVGGSGVGIEDAEGSGRTGAEAGRALLQAVDRAVTGPSSAPPPGDGLTSVTDGGSTERLQQTPLTRALDNRAVLGALFMLPAAALLLLSSSPIRSGSAPISGFTDAKIGRPGQWVGLENFQYLRGRRRHAARALQHALLHARRQRHQVRAGSLARAPAQQAHSLQGGDAGGRAAPVHRADGAVGDRVLVDLRFAVLDHQLDFDEARRSSTNTSTSSASRGMRASR